MDWTEIIFGAVLVLVLFLLAILYGVRQIVYLRRPGAPEAMPSEERTYLLGRARRRLVMSVLLLLLGVMLAGALAYLEVPAGRLADEREAQAQQGDRAPLSPEQLPLARWFAGYWIVFLLVLMAVVFMAGLDVWATRRYGIRQHRKLMADRRAMIEREVARYRQERNGHG